MQDEVRRRRFPSSWSVDETDACFIIRDRNGFALSYVYCEEEPGRRSGANLMTRDEAPADRRQHRQVAGGAAEGLNSAWARPAGGKAGDDFRPTRLRRRRAYLFRIVRLAAPTTGSGLAPAVKRKPRVA
jgi:hypothetical protein